MKRLFVLGLFLLCAQTLFAQKGNDEVILKSGTVLYGVIDSIQHDTLYFKIGNRLPVSFAMSDVHQLQSGKMPKKRKTENYVAVPDSGFFAIGSINAGIRAYSATGRFGYRVSELVQPLVSVNVSRFFASGASFVQCMGGLTGDIGNYCYYSAEAGYGFNTTTSEQFGEDLLNKKGGYSWAFEFGIRRWDAQQTVVYHYGLRLLSQRAEYDYNSQFWDFPFGMQTMTVNEIIDYKRLMFCIGFVF